MPSLNWEFTKPHLDLSPVTGPGWAISEHVAELASASPPTRTVEEEWIDRVHERVVYEQPQIGIKESAIDPPQFVGELL
jgi:hypothetical protein